jgi:hypothetical protein
LRGVHVSPHGPHWSNSYQFVQHFLFAHIPCVQDQFDTRQQLPETHVKEAMRIRNHTDSHLLDLMDASSSRSSAMIFCASSLHLPQRAWLTRQ